MTPARVVSYLDPTRLSCHAQIMEDPNVGAHCLRAWETPLVVRAGPGDPAPTDGTADGMAGVGWGSSEVRELEDSRATLPDLEPDGAGRGTFLGEPEDVFGYQVEDHAVGAGSVDGGELEVEEDFVVGLDGVFEGSAVPIVV